MVVPGERGMWVCVINPSSEHWACTSASTANGFAVSCAELHIE